MGLYDVMKKEVMIPADGKIGGNNGTEKRGLAIVDCHCNVAACSVFKRREGRGPCYPSHEEGDAIVEEEPEEEPVTQYMAPFTGILSEEEITRRPVLVTINNHPLARPQSGISDADIVYELAAEGNVTRLLALFQSELPEEIGPIRSARDYFVHIAKGLDAFYVAHGYSPDAKQLLNNRVVDNVNGMQYDGTLFWRSKDRSAPHNSYISEENILTAAEKTDSVMEMSVLPPFSFHESIEDAKIGDRPLPSLYVMVQIRNSRARIRMMHSNKARTAGR